MRKITSAATWLILTLAVLSGGCSEPNAHTRGVYMLMDTSGTYTRELEKAQHIINYMLAKLNPGDSLAVARIDTGSFSEKDIVAKTTFDGRPSRANQEKRQFRQTIARFVEGVKSSPYTDITGGLLQGVEYLNEKGTAKKTILIFSDLKEDLKKGYIRDIPLKLDGCEVVALNVTKLRSDNIDPREYMQRLEQWRKRVVDGGGRWRVINDLERLDRIFAD
jgi:hypothetical protein